jgi:hypothetical protein
VIRASATSPTFLGLGVKRSRKVHQFAQSKSAPVA